MIDPSSPACPHLAGYAPLSPEQLADPFSIWDRSRIEAPVFFSDELGVWTVTKYADVLEILRDITTYSNDGVLGGMDVPEQFQAKFPDGLWSTYTLINRDPPSHTRARRLCNKAYTPSRISGMQPAIQALADRLIDGFGNGEADLMHDYAHPLTIRAIAGILGFPLEDVDLLLQWTLDALILIGPNQTVEGTTERDAEDADRLERFTRLVEFDAYCADLIADRTATPRDDVISALVHAETDGDPALTPREVSALLTEQVVAGNDTSANMIGHAVLYMRGEPGLWEEVRKDRSLIPAIIEETVRRHTPSKGLFRRTTRDVTLSGVTIPAGQMIHVLWGAANTDPDKFPDPLRLDPRRANLAEHLGWGRGTHFCLGSALAKLQGVVALNTLFDRLPNLDIVPGQTLEYAPAITNVSVMSLRVRF
jgi:cytochrome P450